MAKLDLTRTNTFLRHQKHPQKTSLISQYNFLLWRLYQARFFQDVKDKLFAVWSQRKMFVEDF